MLCLCAGSLHTNKCVEAERQALLKFKDGSIYGRTMLSSWNGENCCEWDGVSCDNLTGHITSLDPDAQSLGGKLNSSICELQHLTSLDLSDNSLKGKIPSCIANMTSLRELFLSYNELEGSIPKSFKSLCQLKYLDLSSNKLSGRLSENIQQLCCDDLEMLFLGNNPFSSGPLPDFSCFSSLYVLELRNASVVGPLPPSLGDCSNLASLDISRNQLNGSLPDTFGRLNLTSLDLYQNKLNGTISESLISGLHSLESLYVGENSLSFNLSSNWIPPFQLDTLVASSCNLGPKFPTWLKNQTMLFDLDISNNGILDSFPEWFWNLSPNLGYLNVSYNKLWGVLPKSLPAVKLEGGDSFWDSSFNNLSGPLPSFPETESLYLSNNMFSGSISAFCASSSPSLLINLDLSSNLLVGPLSDCWGNFQSLEFLSLAKNSLSGKIPKSLGTLQQIESIHLNNNNFSGEIPSLTLCSNLTFIDFGDNNLQGTLPAWVGHNLRQLIVLRLQANKFQGNIPASLCNLLFLQVLDLSGNNITGEIPQCLSDITALSDLKFPRKFLFHRPFPTHVAISDFNPFMDKAVLAWKGEYREYGRNLGLLTAIDLSFNHLTGEIPQSITKLVALIVLNLSGNNLTGFIPNSIGHMEMLESLDLSKNNLCGRMPASISKLTLLSYMNLSFNNLLGKIPLSTQLQSFDPSTYVGNSGLCGPPLTIHCPGDVISPNESPDKHVTTEDEDEEELISFGFYVSLGLGFCVGFWGVCGTLTIKASWRHAYFRFFNNINEWIHVTLVVFAGRMKRRYQVQD